MFRTSRLRISTLGWYLRASRCLQRENLRGRTWRRDFASMVMAGAGLLEKRVKIALVQLASGSDKAANLAHAREKVLEAASSGAEIVVLPECFNSPYGTQYFPRYAEQLLPSPPSEEQSPSWHALSAMARDAGVFLIGGSIPEREVEVVGNGSGDGKEGGKEGGKERGKEGEKLYNTSLVFGRKGELLATHRKVHLFDIDIPGGITFKESEVLSPGNKVTIVEFEGFGKVGLGICYDVRFPELAMVAARKGAWGVFYPGAFNTTTGPLHWRLLGQSRAVDNQVYVAMCSPARDDKASYKAWGHSLVADPMGKVLGEAGEGEEIIYAELDGTEIEKTRKGIPVSEQRRFEVYPDISKGAVKYEEDP